MNEQAPLQTEPTDPQEEKRNAAIDMYIGGKRPTEICRELERSRTWFYETLRRYESRGREGLKSRSRAPHHIHNRTAEDIEAAVVRVRKLLTSGEDPQLKYANYGADAIAIELKRANITPPSRATINRILRRHDLAEPRPRSQAPYRLPKDYPWPQAHLPNQVHLFDFVSRRLTGGERIVGYHLMDQARRWPYLAAQSCKTKGLVSQFLVDAWKSIGLPQALYLDNDVVWRGSSSAPRTFSHIVRLCLLLGVAVIFIPPYTPQANPIIESFNHVWSQNFWQRETFTSLLDVQTKLPTYQHYCRFRRPISTTQLCTAEQLFPDFEPTVLPEDFVVRKQVPLTAGQLHFIRFVSHQGYFSLLNESWQLDAAVWATKIIRAEVAIAEQQLYVYHQETAKTPPELIAQFDFELSEPAQPLDERFARPSVSLWPTTTQVPS